MLDEAEVKRIVKITVSELIRHNLLRDSDQYAYQEVSDRLQRFFSPSAEHDGELILAIESLKGDRYKHILWMFYRDGYTVEDIAERLGVDVRTVTRNKKRLCLKIWKALQN